MAPQIPKLRVPFEIVGTGAAVVEQDSVDEVAQCVYAILATPLGSRLEEPTFGIEDPTFEQVPIDDTEWLRAIEEWESRAAVATTQEVVELVNTVRVRTAAR